MFSTQFKYFKVKLSIPAYNMHHAAIIEFQKLVTMKKFSWKEH